MFLYVLTYIFSNPLWQQSISLFRLLSYCWIPPFPAFPMIHSSYPTTESLISLLARGSHRSEAFSCLHEPSLETRLRMLHSRRVFQTGQGKSNVTRNPYLTELKPTGFSSGRKKYYTGPFTVIKISLQFSIHAAKTAKTPCERKQWYPWNVCLNDPTTP